MITLVILNQNAKQKYVFFCMMSKVVLLFILIATTQYQCSECIGIIFNSWLKLNIYGQEHCQKKHKPGS